MADLEHVLALAKLSLDDADKTTYLETLKKTLGTMKKMDTLSLDDVAPSTHTMQDASYFRDDAEIDYGELSLEKNAPDWDGVFNGYTVPKIV